VVLRGTAAHSTPKQVWGWHPIRRYKKVSGFSFVHFIRSLGTPTYRNNVGNNVGDEAGSGVSTDKKGRGLALFWIYGGC
jgi:hypothetical protein